MDDRSSPSVTPGAAPRTDGPLGEAAAWTVLSYIISGPLLYGGIGWLVDRWLGTEFLVAVGIVGGMALSLYVVFVRYGTAESSSEPPARHSG